MSVKITQYSRLKYANLLKINGVEFWDLPVLPSVKPSQDDLLYQVPSSGDQKTISDISYEFYDDHRLWDVIAQMNEMRLLPGDLKEGDIIRLPSMRRIVEEIRE